jgi:dihydropteroate synthase
MPRRDEGSAGSRADPRRSTSPAADAGRAAAHEAGPPTWRIRGGAIALDRPIVIGIVNVTPDSFSDGGLYRSADAAVEHARRLVAEGADVLDIGGESTRPQAAEPVALDEELARVLPVIRGVRRALGEIPISVDTNKAAVARAALDEGANIINDVSGFRLDPAIGEITAAARAGAILMHSRGGVREMATFAHASYDDVVERVMAELREAVARATSAGMAPDAIVIDPGIGFAKRGEHSLAVLGAVGRLAGLGFPVAVGVSRKRFIGEITGVAAPAERLFGSIGANVAALDAGARLFRVHDVLAHRQALDVAWAVARAGGRDRPAHHLDLADAR